jgi:hypothetical protein
MKRVIAMLSLCSLLTLTGCADSKEIGGKTYESCGLASSLTDDACDKSIKYEVSWGTFFGALFWWRPLLRPSISLDGRYLSRSTRSKLRSKLGKYNTYM